jgi:L-amino acid N-acyltransferase YncA
LNSTVPVRLARLDDAHAIAGIYAPFVLDTAVSFEEEPPDGDEMRRRLAAASGHHPWLVDEDGSEVTGFAFAARHRDRPAYRWSVDVSVYVGDGHRRRGVASRLYTALFEVLVLQGFLVAHAGITLPNQASVSFHEALGFEPLGVYPAVGYKAGAWRDVGWWRRELSPAPDTPPEPSSVDAVAHRLPSILGSVEEGGV